MPNQSPLLEHADEVSPMRDEVGKPHAPSLETRTLVFSLASRGDPHQYIATQVGCSIRQLKKHYEIELVDGLAVAEQLVGQTVFNQATTCDNETVKLNAAKYWLNTQAGWSETRTIKHDISDEFGDFLKQIDGSGRGVKQIESPNRGVIDRDNFAEGEVIDVDEEMDANAKYFEEGDTE